MHTSDVRLKQLVPVSRPILAGFARASCDRTGPYTVVLWLEHWLMSNSISIGCKWTIICVSCLECDDIVEKDERA